MKKLRNYCSTEDSKAGEYLSNEVDGCLVTAGYASIFSQYYVSLVRRSETNSSAPGQTVRKLAMISLTAVYNDILPSYSVKPSKELESLSKEVCSGSLG